MKKHLLAALAFGLATVTGAHATGLTPAGTQIYTYTGTPSNAAPGGALAHLYSGLSLTYNPALNSLRITTSFTNNVVDGYWLAISPGDNPKGNATELAVLYMDLKENRYAVYNYNGMNGANSFNTGGPGSSPVFIQGGSAGLRQSGNSYSFDLNVNAINNGPLNANPGWTGMEFGSRIGIWYHFFDGDIKFNHNNTIRSLHIASQGWSDLSHVHTAVSCSNASAGGTIANGCCPTGTRPGGGTGGTGGGSGCHPNRVPLPGTVLLMGLGLLGLGVFARKRM